MNMNEVITGVQFTEKRTVAADNESKKAGRVKKVYLTIAYDGLTLKDVFAKAFDHDVIAWQTGARNHYESIVDGSSIKISAKSPGRVAEDPKTAYDKYLDSLTPEQRQAELDAQIAKLQAMASK